MGSHYSGYMTPAAMPLNLSLIEFIIEQQHRRAASVPPIQEEKHENPEEVLRDIAKSLIATGQACPASPTNSNATSLDSCQSLYCDTRETSNWPGAPEFTSLGGLQAWDKLALLHSTGGTENVQLPVLTVREASEQPTVSSIAVLDSAPLQSKHQVCNHSREPCCCPPAHKAPLDSNSKAV